MNTTAYVPKKSLALGFLALVLAFAHVIYFGRSPEMMALGFCAILAVLALAVNYLACFSITHPSFMTSVAFLFYFGTGLAILGGNDGDYSSLEAFLLSMLAFSCGALFYNAKTLWSPASLSNDFINREFEGDTSPCSSSLLALWIFGFLFYLILIAQIGVPALSGDFLIRYKVGGMVSTPFEIFWPMACVGFYVKSVRRGKKLYSFMAVSLSILSLALYTLLLHRYATLQLLLSMFFAYTLIKRIKFSKLFVWGMFIILFFAGVQQFRQLTWGGPKDMEALMFVTQQRLFIVGAQTLQFIMKSFPVDFKYFHGVTYIRQIWNAFVPNQRIEPLGFFLFKSVTGSDTQGYDPISLLGEFYANFGLIGCVVGMFLFGMIVQWFHRRALMRKTEYGMIFYSLAAMFILRTFAYSLNGEMFNFLALGVAFLILYTLDSLMKGRMRIPLRLKL